MTQDRRRILDLLTEGRITVAEAEALLAAVSAPASGAEPTGTAGEATQAARPRPKYLRIVVEGGNGERVNIRVPLQLLRAGVKLAALLPNQAQQRVADALSEKGIQVDLATIKPNDLEELIDQLSELTIDVDDDNEKVRIFCE